MKNMFVRLLSTAILVLIIDFFMKGVSVDHFWKSIVVAVVLGLLNTLVKPILVFFTMPITFFSLGLFLLVINAIMIELCTLIVGGFVIDSFLTALMFSVVLSVSQTVVNFFIKSK